MPPQTRSTPRSRPRTPARSGSATGRFTPTPGRRQPTAGAGRRGQATGRRGASARYGLASGVIPGRRTQQKSTVQKALGGLTSALPSLGGGKSKGGSSGRKRGAAGGVALLTAAVGFALKKRSDSSGSQETVAPATPATTAPVTNSTGDAEHIGTFDPPGGTGEAAGGPAGPNTAA